MQMKQKERWNQEQADRGNKKQNSNTEGRENEAEQEAIDTLTQQAPWSLQHSGRRLGCRDAARHGPLQRLCRVQMVQGEDGVWHAEWLNGKADEDPRLTTAGHEIQGLRARLGGLGRST